MDTEGRLQRYRDADCWPTEEALAAMLDNQQSAFVAVRNALPALSRAVQAAAARLRESGRLIYVGAGASGPASSPNNHASTSSAAVMPTTTRNSCTTVFTTTDSSYPL